MTTTKPRDLFRVNRTDEPSVYRVIERATGRPLAVVAKTGTHLDHYPWDWYLLEGVEPVERYRSVGTCDTKAHAIDQIAYALGHPYGRFEYAPVTAPQPQG